MELGTYAMAATVIIGLVNGVKLAVDKNWKGLALFSASVIAGLVLGYLKWFGLPSPEVGLLIGLGASGVYEVSQRIGGK